MTILDHGSVVGIIRYREAGPLNAVVDLLVEAGVSLVEITLDTPNALAAISRAADAGLTIGAGTVLSVDDVRAAAEAGARFVVSPSLTDEVVEGAQTLGVEPIPGILTPTELRRAALLGAEAVKVFPVGPVGGAGFVAALRGPFREIALLPTGGVAIDEISAYLDAGASAVGLGGALTGTRPPRNDDEFDALRARAIASVEAAAR
jgi:2-dehydro-3-deoxyphosphogluconate aldolase / (4S)-4-hydroxy-2-oxoglutarate aldolase